MNEILLNAISQIPWWIFPIVILVLIFKTPWSKGKVGEFFVNKINDTYLDKNEYIKIKDITLKLSDGSTTQIDHVLISKYGIFVIETKNYKGWIFGNEKWKLWTQTTKKGKNTFQNPIRQNYKHIKALEEVIEELMEIGINKFIPVIVFIGECEFKTEMPKMVHRGISYIDYIKSFNEIILSNIEIQTIVNKISRRRLEVGFKTDIEHVKNLKSRMN